MMSAENGSNIFKGPLLYRLLRDRTGELDFIQTFHFANLRVPHEKGSFLCLLLKWLLRRAVPRMKNDFQTAEKIMRD